MSFEINKVQEEILERQLLKIEPFSILEAVDVRRLILSAKRIQIKKGGHVFEPGDLPSDVYFLLEGAIKVSTPNYGYKEVIHELLNAPSIFGLSNCCLNGSIRNNAISLSHHSTCFAIPFLVIRDLMKQNPEFNLKLFSLLSQRIKEKEQRVEQLMLSDARDRVMGFIRKYALENGIRIGYEILLKHNFTQQDIADFTGTSRQTVTNILKELKENRMIKVQRRSILIHDINDLNKVWPLGINGLFPIVFSREQFYFQELYNLKMGYTFACP
jgi:CRP/FNR family cyclic AMP-dependent transcriptional regulator